MVLEQLDFTDAGRMRDSVSALLLDDDVFFIDEVAVDVLQNSFEVKLSGVLWWLEFLGVLLGLCCSFLGLWCAMATNLVYDCWVLQLCAILVAWHLDLAGVFQNVICCSLMSVLFQISKSMIRNEILNVYEPIVGALANLLTMTSACCLFVLLFDGFISIFKASHFWQTYLWTVSLWAFLKTWLNRLSKDLRVVLLFWKWTVKSFLILQLKQLKRLSILLPNVSHISKAIEIVHQMQHFLIWLISIKRHDWDTIVNMKSKWIYRVVHDYDFGKVELFWIYDS